MEVVLAIRSRIVELLYRLLVRGRKDRVQLKGCIYLSSQSVQFPYAPSYQERSGFYGVEASVRWHYRV